MKAPCGSARRNNPRHTWHLLWSSRKSCRTNFGMLERRNRTGCDNKRCDRFLQKPVGVVTTRKDSRNSAFGKPWRRCSITLPPRTPRAPHRPAARRLQAGGSGYQTAFRRSTLREWQSAMAQSLSIGGAGRPKHLPTDSLQIHYFVPASISLILHGPIFVTTI